MRVETVESTTFFGETWAALEYCISYREYLETGFCGYLVFYSIPN